MSVEQQTIQLHHGPPLEICRLRGMHQPIAPHSHSYFVIGCVEKGRRRMQLAGRDFRIGPGAMVVFTPGTAHACQPSGKTGFDCRCFHVRASTLLDLLSDDDCGAEPSAIAAEPLADPQLFKTLTESHRLFENGAAAAGLEGLSDALARLVEHHPESVQPVQSEPVNPDAWEARLVDRVAEWLKSSYSERIRLEDMAAIAGVDKYRLLRAFVRIRGITPYRHLESLRVGKAREMLAAGATIVDAALAAGFADQSHLNRHFKRQTGLTPAQYRRAVAAGPAAS